MNDASERRLSKVHPELASRVRTLATNLLKKGYQVEVTQGLRTVAEQDALYAQGRTKPGKKVTSAKGGSSYHNYGLAVDFALIHNGQYVWPDPHPVWSAIGEEAARLGLEWGGTWKTPDKPHVQMASPPIALLRNLLNKGGLPEVWAAVRVPDDVA